MFGRYFLLVDGVGLRVWLWCFQEFIWGFPKIRGTLIGDPHNKDYSILGSILGFPYFGKLPFSYSSADPLPIASLAQL